jgi:hypothetical protein
MHFIPRYICLLFSEEHTSRVFIIDMSISIALGRQTATLVSSYESPMSQLQHWRCSTMECLYVHGRRRYFWFQNELHRLLIVLYVAYDHRIDYIIIKILKIFRIRSSAYIVIHK